MRAQDGEDRLHVALHLLLALGDVLDEEHR